MCLVYAVIFVVVSGPGRVQQRVQRGVVGLGSCRYALACIRHQLMFEMPGRCVSRAVAGCYRSGWVVIVLGMQLFLWSFMGQGECSSVLSVVLLV